MGATIMQALAAALSGPASVAAAIASPRRIAQST